MQCPALRRYFDALLRTPVLLITPSTRPSGERAWPHGVKVECPTGRTTLTRGAWSARLARVDGGRVDQAQPQPLSEIRPVRPSDHPGAGVPPPEAQKGTQFFGWITDFMGRCSVKAIVVA